MAYTDHLPSVVAVGDPTHGYCFHGPFPDAAEAGDWGQSQITESDPNVNWAICPLVPPVIAGKPMYAPAPVWPGLYSQNDFGSRVVHVEEDGYSVLDLISSQDWLTGGVDPADRFEIVHNGNEVLPGGSHGTAPNLQEALALIEDDRKAAAALAKPPRYTVGRRSGYPTVIDSNGGESVGRFNSTVMADAFAAFLNGREQG